LDLAAWNTFQVEEVFDFEELLAEDIDNSTWDREIEVGRDDGLNPEFY